MAGPTGCGLCGLESLAEAMRPPARVSSGLVFSPREIMRAIASVGPAQALNRETRAVHAAGFWEPGNGLVALREDVGRHNALDKTLGALARVNADFAAGYMLITSRASYEMVQKCATVGIAFLAAFSAPTAFAVRLAQKTGMTLVAFARRDRHVVYANPERLK